MKISKCFHTTAVSKQELLTLDTEMKIFDKTSLLRMSLSNYSDTRIQTIQEALADALTN
jgi:hypothetical protein